MIKEARLPMKTDIEIAQAAAMDRLLPFLTQEEEDV